MAIKRVLIAAVLLLAFSVIGVVGCADSNAEPAAMTGQTHSYQDTSWSQP